MTEYRLPDEPDVPKVYNKRGEVWTKGRSVFWYSINGDSYTWGDVVHYAGPLTTTPPTPPIKEGDTGLTAEQVWNLPEGTVIWPERAEYPEPWMRHGDYWESLSEAAGDVGDLQCAYGDSFTVLRLGGGEE